MIERTCITIALAVKIRAECGCIPDYVDTVYKLGKKFASRDGNYSTSESCSVWQHGKCAAHIIRQYELVHK